MPPERGRGGGGEGARGSAWKVINLHAKPKPRLTFIPFSPVPSSDPLSPSASSDLFPLLVGHHGSARALTPASAGAGLLPRCTGPLGTLLRTQSAFNKGSGQCAGGAQPVRLITDPKDGADSLRLQPCQPPPVCGSAGELSMGQADCPSLSSARILSLAPVVLRSNANSLTHCLTWLPLTSHLASPLPLPAQERSPCLQPCLPYGVQGASLPFTSRSSPGTPSLHVFIWLLHLHSSTWVTPLPPGSLPCVRCLFYLLPEHPVPLTVTSLTA